MRYVGYPDVNSDVNFDVDALVTTPRGSVCWIPGMTNVLAQ